MRIRHHHTDKRPSDMTRKQQPTQQQQDKKWNLSKCLFFTKLVLYLIPHRRPFSPRSLSCYIVEEVDAVYRRKKIEIVVGTKPVTTAILHRRQRPFFPVMKRQQKSEQSTISFSTTVDTTDDPVRVYGGKEAAEDEKNEREWKFCSYFLLKRIKPVYYFNITFWKYFTSPGPSSCGLSPDVELSEILAVWWAQSVQCSLKKRTDNSFISAVQIEWKSFSEIWRSKNENWIEYKR